MATNSSVLAWRIPWTKGPGRLQYMGLQRVGLDWATNTHALFYPQETPGEYKVLHPTASIKYALMHIADIYQLPHSIYNELHMHIRCYNFPIWFQRTVFSSFHCNQIATLPAPTFMCKHRVFSRKSTIFTAVLYFLSI